MVYIRYIITYLLFNVNFTLFLIYIEYFLNHKFLFLF